MASIEMDLRNFVSQIKRECMSASHQIANALRNSSAKVLRGQRSGRRYRVPGTGRLSYNKKSKTATVSYRYYTASAPGEAPAVRTGTLRSSLGRYTAIKGGEYIGGIRSFQNYANYLEDGTSKMAPRPFHDRTIEGAEPEINRIMNRVTRG